MNFYDSQIYIWSLGRFFGLYYFTNHQNELKITNNSVISALVPGICLVLITIYGIANLIPDEKEVLGIGTIFLVVSQIGIMMQFMNCVVIFIMSFIHRKGVMIFFKKINELDDILIKKLKINFDYKKMKTISSTRMIGLEIGLIIICFIINYFTISNNSYIIIVLIYNYAAGSGLTSAMEYIHCTKMVKFRFESLNDILRTHNINPKDLKTMIECHYTLNGLITKMNAIFGLRQLSSITNDFVIILVQLYSFFVSIENDFRHFIYVKFLIGSLMIPYLVAKIFFMSTNCHTVLNNKKKFGNLLKRIENLRTTDEDIFSLVYTLYNYYKF